MNAENFKDFIENPSRLYQLSYQELKSLVLQYPFSTNLHYLLLQKSEMEQHRELEQNRQKAATYSVDRAFLFNLIREWVEAEAQEPALQLEDEYLELKDLSLLAAEPAPVLETESQKEVSPPDLALPKLTSSHFDGEEDEADASLDLSLDQLAPAAEGANTLEWSIAESELDEIPQAAPVSQVKEPQIEAESPSDFLASTKLMETLSAIADIEITRVLPTPVRKPENEVPIPQTTSEALFDIETASHTPKGTSNGQLETEGHSLLSKTAPTAQNPIEKKKDGPAPQPKQSFSSWVQQFQPEHVKQQLSDLMEAKKREELKRLKKRLKKAKKKKKKAAAKDRKIIQFAAQSLTVDKTIASETLAELLIKQEQFEKAIQMYKRLELIFPEKSAYFAQKIEKLKKL